MHRVSISIITLVAMWATIILQCLTIRIINKRKVPDEPFDKDINVRCKDEPQTCDTCKFELYCPEMCKGCCEWDSHYEPKDEPQTCSVSGRPYTDCYNCEYFKCTADEPRTELKGFKRLVKGSDPCDGCIYNVYENVLACVACVLKDKQSGKE